MVLQSSFKSLTSYLLEIFKISLDNFIPNYLLYKEPFLKRINSEGNMYMCNPMYRVKAYEFNYFYVLALQFTIMFS